MMKGYELKAKIMENGLKLWQVAAAYGVTDSTFSRKLRFDFNAADTQKLLSIIDELQTKNATR